MMSTRGAGNPVSFYTSESMGFSTRLDPVMLPGGCLKCNALYLMTRIAPILTRVEESAYNLQLITGIVHPPDRSQVFK